MANTESVVTKLVLEFARRKNASLAEVTPTQSLVRDLGLASLDLAELVAMLEMDLQTDPFAAGASIAEIRTVGDLVNAYLTVAK